MFFVVPELNPDSDKGVKIIREEGYTKGSKVYERYYPDTFSDESDVRELAEKECRKWWTGLTGWNDYEHWYSDIRQLFTKSFVKGYMWNVNQAEQERKKKEEERARWKAEQEKRERQAALQRKAKMGKEITLGILDQRDLPDGVLYVIDFFDPVRMTQAISFGVSVKDDGVVELEEI